MKRIKQKETKKGSQPNILHNKYSSKPMLYKPPPAPLDLFVSPKQQIVRQFQTSIDLFNSSYNLTKTQFSDSDDFVDFDLVDGFINIYNTCTEQIFQAISYSQQSYATDDFLNCLQGKYPSHCGETINRKYCGCYDYHYQPCL